MFTTIDLVTAYSTLGLQNSLFQRNNDDYDDDDDEDDNDDDDDDSNNNMTLSPLPYLETPPRVMLPPLLSEG